MSRPGATTGIDIHGHGVPASFLDDVKRAGLGDVGVQISEGKYILTFPGQKPLRPVPAPMLDFEKRLQWLDEQQMHQQLIGPWLDVHGQELPPAVGQDWVRRLNDAMAESVAGSGGRLRAHATLHLADPAAAARELERAGRDLGMSGAMIPTNVPAGELHDPSYEVLWEAAAGMGAPIILHPPTVGPSSCIAGMAEFGGLYGRLIDTTMTAARLLLAGVFDRHPGLRLVLVHGGGFLPFQTGRLDREHAEGRLGQGLMRSPSEYVRGRYYYDTVLMSADAIRLLLDLVGAGRVMIGSDYPFSVGAPALTEGLRGAVEDAGVRAAVSHDNAAALFKTEMALA
jgi:aminocarboxymuconate-semialdehyde decarboxylase